MYKNNVGFRNEILQSKKVSLPPNVNPELLAKTTEGRRYEAMVKSKKQVITPLTKREKLLDERLAQRKEARLAAFIENNKQDHVRSITPSSIPPTAQCTSVTSFEMLEFDSSTG